MPSSITIQDAHVLDVRVPTSDTLLGSDPFHRKPNYSAVLLTLQADSPHAGVSLTFTIGAGNDWIAHGVQDLLRLLRGRTLDEFTADPGNFHRLFIDHHQLRWLADGVFRMAAGAIVNAMWDLWAKSEHKPLWKLLVDLPSQTIVDCIDWRYLRDALTPEEACQILEAGCRDASQREQRLLRRGPKAYSTAGWLGLTDAQIREKMEQMRDQGFDCFKLKVGRDLDQDRQRLAFMRELLGNEARLMLDANQIWGVDEAITWMVELAPFHPTWIEEPTARDDVLGYVKIAQAMAEYGIGVAAGEQVPSPSVFKQLLSSRAISYCQIDATRLAGVNDVMAVILLAAKYGVPVCPHAGGIGLCNMIQHYAVWDQIRVAAHSDTQLVEYLDFLQEGVFIHPVQVDAGAYVTPQTPGWGLEMEPDFVAQHLYPSGSVWQGREESGSVVFLA